MSAPEITVLLQKYPEDVAVEKAYTMGVVQTHLVLSEVAFGHDEAIKHIRFIDERILQLHQQRKIEAIVEKYKLPLRSEH